MRSLRSQHCRRGGEHRCYDLSSEGKGPSRTLNRIGRLCGSWHSCASRPSACSPLPCSVKRSVPLKGLWFVSLPSVFRWTSTLESGAPDQSRTVKITSSFLYDTNTEVQEEAQALPGPQPRWECLHWLFLSVLLLSPGDINPPARGYI